MRALRGGWSWLLGLVAADPDMRWYGCSESWRWAASLVLGGYVKVDTFGATGWPVYAYAGPA